MSSKKKIILLGIISILLVVLSVLLIFIPKINININGDKNIFIRIGEDYEELGAKAILKKNLTSREIPVEIQGEINNQKPGKYIITYKSSYQKLVKIENRVVNVIDTDAPIISLNKPVVICKKNNLVEIDAKAIDNIDGDISEKIKYRIDKEKINIYVMDSSNNKSEIVEDLVYADGDKPTITLNGNKIIQLGIGASYNDQGATAYDTCDGNITDKIQVTGNVDTNIPGEYTIVYKVYDSLNNENSTTRKVIISEKEEITNQVTGEAVIYLTFDDGPGPYTEEILNTLDKYGIKATFFVTNQFGNKNYISHIKTEYEKGHTVGIHTYSHKWSIYETMDTYLNDFNKIYDIVVEQTGVAPKYFRFPGGTSNHQAKVSMKQLTEVMTEKGFIYYDWHIDCGDTHGKKATKEYILNIVKTHLKGNGHYIILMHDIKKNTRDALPEIIEYAKSCGYTFSKIDENTPIKQFKPYN